MRQLFIRPVQPAKLETHNILISFACQRSFCKLSAFRTFTSIFKPLEPLITLSRAHTINLPCTLSVTSQKYPYKFIKFLAISYTNSMVLSFLLQHNTTNFTKIFTLQINQISWSSQVNTEVPPKRKVNFVALFPNELTELILTVFDHHTLYKQKDNYIYDNFSVGGLKPLTVVFP